MLLLNILKSPFKFPKIKIYLGKVKSSPYVRKSLNFKIGKNKINIKISYYGVGWKVKYNEYVSYESSPYFSIIWGNKQFCISVKAPVDHDDVYWESYLYYEYLTDKKESKLCRLMETRDKQGMAFTNYSPPLYEPKKIDYYYEITKRKYRKY